MEKIIKYSACIERYNSHSNARSLSTVLVGDKAFYDSEEELIQAIEDNDFTFELFFIVKSIQLHP